MGTELHVTIWSADDARAEAAASAVFREFDRLDAMMSVWKGQSDIVMLNAAAGERAVSISSETREVLRIARDISEQTGGMFDITFAALSGLWKFDYQDKDESIPDRKEIDRRLPLVNYRDVVIDEAAGTAMLRRKGMRVNLGGIGKGYAVDRGVDILRRSGLRDFMIQAGGDMYVAGTRGDRPWRLGIRDPRGPADRVFAALDLSDATFSTSGDYERFFMKQGVRYHHIIDLRTGEPARLSRSVTLVTDRAVIADALAKGVFILGPDAGMALIERTPGVQGVIVSAKNEVSISSGLRKRLILVAPPTDAP
ncbi:MAG TPA: FAD:protein FMN transferase [Vicinamibacterales bacterium]|nr:FAD:protein FMN transferase [Vicinamibacterales bacterium]